MGGTARDKQVPGTISRQNPYQVDRFRDNF